MADPNLIDFYGRVARIERARSEGYGFEAPGTLGRSSYRRSNTGRRSALWSVLFLVLCGFLMKGVMYHQIGADTYTLRVSAMRTGDGIERVGAWIMQADPVTVQIAKGLEKLLFNLK